MNYSVLFKLTTCAKVYLLSFCFFEFYFLLCDNKLTNIPLHFLILLKMLLHLIKNVKKMV